MTTAFFLSSGPPFPEVGARRIRDQQILTLLAQRFDRVEAVCMGNPSDLEKYQEEAARELGSKVRLSLYSPKTQTLTSRGLDIIRPHFAQGHNAPVAEYIRTQARRGDLIWASRLRMAKYVSLGRELGCSTVLDEHQVESDLLFDNAFSNLRYWYQGLQALRCAFYERRICEQTDLVIAGAEIDRNRMEKLNPEARVKILPYSVDPRDYELPSPAEAERDTVLFFTDLDYAPSVHAVGWLSTEILPRVRAAMGSRAPRFVVSTSHIPAEIEKLYPEIEFHRTRSRGDLLDQLAKAKLVIFPLRYGRGNRINLLEAMAAGMPIVTTGKGADGVPVMPSRDVLLADDPDEFTSAIFRLLRDEQDRRSLSEHARTSAQSIYSVHNDLERFDEILSELKG